MDIYNGIEPETGKRFEDLTDDEFISCFGIVKCRDCKKRVDGTCERLKKVELARPWFACQESATGYICRDYEPAEWQTLLKKYWRGTAIYASYFPYYVQVCKTGDQSARYFIRFRDFYDDTMFDENGLKWTYKQYYKRSRESPTGYELIKEFREDKKHEKKYNP